MAAVEAMRSVEAIPVSTYSVLSECLTYPLVPPSAFRMLGVGYVAAATCPVDW